MYKKTNHTNNKTYYNIHMTNKCALPPLPYITWGLTWNLKPKRRECDIYIYIYIYILRETIHIKRKEKGRKREENNNKEEKGKIYKEIINKQEKLY